MTYARQNNDVGRPLKVDILDIIRTSKAIKRKEDGALRKDTLKALKTINPSIDTLNRVFGTIIKVAE